MAGFIQIIEYKTSRNDELQVVMEKFRQERIDAGEKPPMTQMYATVDRDQPNTYRAIIRFDSYEKAMENSNRGDTNEFAQRMADLCDGPPTFYNLDVIDEESF